MRRIDIDGRLITSPQALHTQLKAAMCFPDYYGANLDALYDMLTDISEPVCIAVTDSAAAKAALDEYFWRFLDVVSDANKKTGKTRLLLI